MFSSTLDFKASFHRLCFYLPFFCAYVWTTYVHRFYAQLRQLSAGLASAQLQAGELSLTPFSTLHNVSSALGCIQLEWVLGAVLKTAPLNPKDTDVRKVEKAFLGYVLSYWSSVLLFLPESHHCPTPDPMHPQGCGSSPLSTAPWEMADPLPRPPEWHGEWSFHSGVSLLNHSWASHSPPHGFSSPIGEYLWCSSNCSVLGTTLCFFLHQIPYCLPLALTIICFVFLSFFDCS